MAKISARRTRLLLRLRPLLRRLCHLRGQAPEIAGGLALGTAISVQPILGKLFLAPLLATCWRLSRPAALVPVLLVNPVVVPAVLTGNYLVGRQLCGGPSLERVAGKLQAFGAGLGSGELDALAAAGQVLLDLGQEILMPLIIGSLMVGTVGAVLVHRLSLLLFAARERRRMRALFSPRPEGTT